jgi:16S rRNA (guanine966-N2)-methyltransferase
LKGRVLVYPRAGLRPTKDIAKQAMFNIIGVEVRQAQVCDLYAGAGSLGIEALSRGAASAVFVEQHAAAVRFLRRNLVGVENARVIRGDVLRVLAKLAGTGFDIVLADPPYLHGLVQTTIERMAEHSVLAVGGWFVAEHHRQEVPVPPAGWVAIKQGTYGDTLVSVMRRRS